MIPGYLLNWALVAVSLFNTILLLWLGITLWLNADRRGAGIVATAAGFALGAAFFVAQSALLLSPTLQLTRSNTLWVALGTAPVVLLPYVWYVVLLWYNGYWPRCPSALRQRHQPWLGLAGTVLVLGFACLTVLGWPYLPVIGGLQAFAWPFRELIKASILRVPVIPLGYALYVLLCVALSLDALRRPGLTERILGDAARARARPWLTAATLLLLVVAILVAGAVLWTITHTAAKNGLQGSYVLTPDRLETIGRFDLVLSVLIAGVVVLLGRAVSAYELFTGKVLPRRELARQWARALALAGGYGALMGGALVWGLEPVYAVLLTAVMMTTFFALLVWGSYVEWERAMRHLRPFVASQRWYEALITVPRTGERPPDPFVALCRDLLGTTAAYLIPAGPTAAFVAAQRYPADLDEAQPTSIPQPPDAEDPALIVPLDPALYGGAAWAVSLWREQGLIGMLLLGPREDGSLYTQEEIEIARSTGERLLDTAASLALSQRLMSLQRERMATTQILDQRTRRVLHDEVLPLIHTAMLSLAAGRPGDLVIQPLSDAHGQLSNLLRELPPTVAPEIARLGLLNALRKAVDVEFAPACGEVIWECEPGVEDKAAALSSLAAETLYFAAREAARNATKHAAVRPGALCLRIAARVLDGQLQLTIQDNGPAVRTVEQGARGSEQVAPGSTGQGLDLHSTFMAIVGGSLSLETVPGRATRVQLVVPLGGAV